MTNLEKLIESFGVTALFLNIVSQSEPESEEQKIQKELVLKAYKNISAMIFETVVKIMPNDDGIRLREFMKYLKKEVDHARDTIKLLNINDVNLNSEYEFSESVFGENLIPTGIKMQ